ncbi:hypothetical protein, partial [Microbacterium sp. SA156]|uniref:hypothetical protein n=1 Tax=Microbacterium sp. SA156 TaxID=3121524 RepID=UPI003B9F1AF3
SETDRLRIDMRHLHPERIESIKTQLRELSADVTGEWTAEARGRRRGRPLRLRHLRLRRRHRLLRLRLRLRRLHRRHLLRHRRHR